MDYLWRPLGPGKIKFAHPIAMRVLLISTYELGHQPFGVASPAAWLAAKGADVLAWTFREKPCAKQPCAKLA